MTNPFGKKIAIASDHRGVAIKAKISDRLKVMGYEPVDCGAHSEESVDYPDFIIPAAEKLSRGECDAAIGICYTGIGSSIVANKVKGVRASLVEDVKRAELTRAHNDSNMLILASGFVAEKTILEIIETWLRTPYEGGRHERRVNRIKQYEQDHGK